MESFNIDRVNGVVVGYTFTYTYDDGAGYTSTNTSTYDADGNWTGSTFSDSTGSSSSSSRVTQTDGTFIESGTWTDGVSTSNYNYHYDANWNLLDGTSTWNGETTTYGADWTIISQARNDVAGLTAVTAGTMAADVFGADAVYADDGFGGRTYYDAAGDKLGTSYTGTWTDNTTGFTSTNTSYNDANWNWLGSEWIDSNGVSGSKSRVTDIDGTFIESGTWTDGVTTSSYSYHYDANWNLLDGTSTWNGETTTYGANWTIEDRKSVVLGKGG